MAHGVPAFITSVRYHITDLIDSTILNPTDKRILRIVLNGILARAQQALELGISFWRLWDELVLGQIATQLIVMVDLLIGFAQRIPSLLGGLTIPSQYQAAILALQNSIQQFLQFLRSELVRFRASINNGDCEP